MKTKVKILLTVIIAAIAVFSLSTKVSALSKDNSNTNMKYAWIAYGTNPTDEIGYVGSGIEYTPDRFQVSLYDPDRINDDTYYFIGTKNDVGSSINSSVGQFTYIGKYTMYGDELYTYRIPFANIFNVLELKEDWKMSTYEGQITYDVPDTTGKLQKITTYFTLEIYPKKDIKITGSDSVKIRADGLTGATVTELSTNDIRYTRVSNKLWASLKISMDARKNYKVFAYEIEAEGEFTSDVAGATITFNVGNEYNGKKAYVGHLKDDGTFDYILTTVKDGSVSMYTLSFSPFIVAIDETSTGVVKENAGAGLANEDGTTNESRDNINTDKDDIANDENETSEEASEESKDGKDVTPKTGVKDVLSLSVVLATLCGAGLIITKRV